MTIITSLTGLGAWLNAHALWPHLPVWSYALLALLDTHVTTACVTLYLHRGQTHRSISFTPLTPRAKSHDAMISRDRLLIRARSDGSPGRHSNEYSAGSMDRFL